MPNSLSVFILIKVHSIIKMSRNKQMIGERYNSRVEEKIEVVKTKIKSVGMIQRVQWFTFF